MAVNSARTAAVTTNHPIIPSSGSSVPLTLDSQNHKKTSFQMLDHGGESNKHYK